MVLDVINKLKEVEQVLIASKIGDRAADAPHAQLQPLLHDTMEFILTMEGSSEAKQRLRVCISTMIGMEAQLCEPNGHSAFQGILYLSIYLAEQILSRLAASSARTVKPSQVSVLSNSRGILKVYRACYSVLPGLQVLVVVCSCDLRLPGALQDGTPIVNINYHQPQERLTSALTMYDEEDLIDNMGRSRAYEVLALRSGDLHALVNVWATAVAFVRGKWHIIVGVTGKGFIPQGEGVLPKFLYDVPVKVREFRLVPLHRQSWSCEPPQPQVGGAIAPIDMPCRMATIGPALTAVQPTVFFTVAHLFEGLQVGAAVIAPGHVPMAMRAIAASGCAQAWERFEDWVHSLKSAAAAVQRESTDLAAHVVEDQITIGTVVHIDRGVDLAAVRVFDEVSADGFGPRGFCWTNLSPRDFDADALISLDNAWSKEELDAAVANYQLNNVETVCTGYGARTSVPITCTVTSIVPAAVGNHIAVEGYRARKGDSGAAFITRTADGTAKLLGIAAFKGVFEDTLTQLRLIPAWTLQEKAEQWQLYA